ncbi:hypothetical protein GAPWKB30_1356 [Gilliamella apicola]|nr:hypothetical protein GAPWKB30_1356 [Gilliamella apicola]
MIKGGAFSSPFYSFYCILVFLVDVDVSKFPKKTNKYQ